MFLTWKFGVNGFRLFFEFDLKFSWSDLPGGADSAKQNEPTTKKFHKHIKKLAMKKIQKNIRIQTQHQKSMKVSFAPFY